LIAPVVSSSFAERQMVHESPEQTIHLIIIKELTGLHYGLIIWCMKKFKRSGKYEDHFELFDRLFKRLMSLSNRATISFINALFGTHYALNSIVEYPSTETQNAKGRKRTADMLIRIIDKAGEHLYLLEAQIKNDANIAIRVFEYTFGLARWRYLEDEGVWEVYFPEARLIFLEGRRNTPESETIRIRFGDQGTFDYKIPALRFFKYSIAELEEQGLTLLLPFYVLKLRHKVERAQTGEKRRLLAEEMAGILQDLEAAIERGAKAGRMSVEDMRAVIEHTDVLMIKLYKDYKEFRGVTKMVKGALLTPSEQAAKRTERRLRKEFKAERQKAEAERQKAEAERQKAEAERRCFVHYLNREGRSAMEIANAINLDIATVQAYIDKPPV
jgi:DNA-binding NarL/FixJ family response regulator